MEKILPFPQNFSFLYGSVTQPFAPGGMSHSIIFLEKTRPVVCWYAESPYLCTRFPEGRRPRRGGAGRNEKKRAKRKKSLAVSSETLTFAARFPLERGGAPRDGGSLRRGHTRKAFFEGIGSKRQAASPVPSRRGGRVPGARPPGGKN